MDWIKHALGYTPKTVKKPYRQQTVFEIQHRVKKVETPEHTPQDPDRPEATAGKAGPSKARPKGYAEAKARVDADLAKFGINPADVNPRVYRIYIENALNTHTTLHPCPVGADEARRLQREAHRNEPTAEQDPEWVPWSTRKLY